MKKTLKITAIILSVVAVIVTHPFLRVEAREITSNAYINNTNYPHLAISYLHYTQNSSYLLPVNSNTNEQGLEAREFVCEVVLNFDVICDCSVTLNLERPNGSTSNSYVPKLIVYGGKIVNQTNNQTKIDVWHTNQVIIKYIFTYNTLNANFGYYYTNNNNDPNYSYSSGNIWVSAGGDYFKIQSFSYNNFIQHDDLGSMVYLLDNIDSNIDGVESLLSSINEKLGILDSVNWIKQETTFQGYTTDFNNYSSVAGYHDAGYYVMNGVSFSSSVANGIYRLTIPLGVGSSTFSNIKLYQYWSNAPREFTPDTVLYFPSRYYATLYFTINETYHQWPQSNYPLCIYFNRQMYYYTEYQFSLEYIQNTDENYWMIFNTMKQLAQMNKLNGDLDQIIYLLENMNINVTNQDVTNIVNQYDINIDQVFNVENNINSQLQQQMQNYTPDNTSILQRLNDSSILLKSVMNQINGIEIFSIPIAVALVGIVLLAIVG